MKAQNPQISGGFDLPTFKADVSFDRNKMSVIGMSEDGTFGKVLGS